MAGISIARSSSESVGPDRDTHMRASRTFMRSTWNEGSSHPPRRLTRRAKTCIRRGQPRVDSRADMNRCCTGRLHVDPRADMEFARTEAEHA